MMLLSRSIFIDTRYFLGKSLDFQSKEFSALTDLARKELVKVYLTDITEREILKKISEETSLAYSKINCSDTRYLKAIPLFRRFLSLYSESKAVQYFTERFYEFKKRCQVEIISSNSVKVLDIYRLFCEETPPFNSDKAKNRKNEFPDAFALATITDWSEKERKKAYILSGDSDWSAYASKSFIYPFDDNAELWLNVIPTLSEFLDLVIRTEDDLSDIAAFADSIINANLKAIADSAKKALKDTVFSDTSNDVDIDKIADFVISLSLRHIEIISVTRDGAIYNLEFDVEFINQYVIENYESAVYDDERNVFLNVQRHICYKRFTESCFFVVEVGYKEGIPGNFQIISIEPPDTLEVSFEDGQDVNPEELVLKLPVIVCGVDNGMITATGKGYECFPNIEEAKRKYPELNIYKQSKSFTAAMGNKINEQLRFETWKAYEIYSD